ncbi:MAG: 2-oxoacid:acceptor oxidoreductase family protein [bacterium]|nr:2-oxoacid:acceptor oxidoreductase family protein [bacterium]
MKQEIILAGFGGQGVIKAGVLLAYAAMKENKRCTHFPSYGAEMRGGTANCSVIISDLLISSPVIGEADTVIAMNEPSLIKFEPRLKKGGLLIYNSSIIASKPKRSDIELLAVPANEIAESVGSAKSANMVVVGAYIAKTKIVSPESVKLSIPIVFPGKEAFLTININAVDKGMAVVK